MNDRLRTLVKSVKIITIVSSSVLFIGYQINRTCRTINNIVNHSVLDKEKKYVSEYIYIDDPAYTLHLQLERDRENRQSIRLGRIWKSLRHSLQWRLLWLCRHGSPEQRNVALEQLAAFKMNKPWDCIKVAQALDKKTAVLLARTKGADLRYFLPPPIHVRRAALSSELLSFKFRDMLLGLQGVKRHSCISHFLSKYFINVHEVAVDDGGLSKPDSISERDLCLRCLDAIHHHLSIFHTRNYEEDQSSMTLVKLGLMPRLAEIFLRNQNDTDLDFAVLRILTLLSLHKELVNEYFQNGLISQLARLIKSNDVRLSSSAAICLANLSGEECYRPGLYLLHPLYRTRTPHFCDTLLVHGLRGGVFVTWRQRDKKCAEPIGLIEVTMSDNECDPCEQKQELETYLDPELNQVIEDLNDLDEESLLLDYEVVLHDIPIEAKRDTGNEQLLASNKRAALLKEEEDRCNYTFCWPKDWLPKDCSNLRILGVNYWSSLSEWLERCPLQQADIASRAAELATNLLDAGVGTNDIVWLAHSMGGLIVKQILVDAANSEENDLFKNLSIHTKAVLFFSTPHKGSGLAKMPRPASAVLWPSSDVRQLQENSPDLIELHNNFLKYADDYEWETISFAETMPTLVTAFKVPVHFVPAHTADLGRGVFYQLPLDHLSICKPATRESILYTTVVDVLLRVTSPQYELLYANPIIKWLKRLLKFFTQRMAQDVVDTFDENKNGERLRWLDQAVLDTFTDF